MMTNIDITDMDSLNKIKSYPLSFLELSNRTVNPLINVGVNTLDDLLNIRANGFENIKQFGKKAKQEIENALFDFIQNTVAPVDPRPLLCLVSDTETLNLTKTLVPFVKNLLSDIGQDRDYEILKLRYGLESEKVYTLQEIGDYYGISRERVRQLENQAKGNLEKAINGRLQTRRWRLQPVFANEVINVLSAIKQMGDLLTEKEFVHFIQTRYSFTISKNELGSIRLLLSLAGYEALQKATTKNMSRIFIEPSWKLPGKVDINMLYGAINSAYHLLLKEVKPISKFEVVVQVNRTLKKRLDPIYLEYAIKICPDIEQLVEETFQIRFETLPSVGDKAYRVLYQVNRPLHIRNILREINRLQINAGLQANIISRTLQQQLVSDKRIEPIGRSGEWFLIEWENIAKDTILELMQEFFHVKQTSATAREVYEYVHSKRDSVKKIGSIQTYLVDQKTLFTRVADGKYSLAAWGEKPFESQRFRSANRNDLDDQIDSAIKAIFANENTDRLPLWSTIEKVRYSTGRAATTIRKRISKSVFLKIETISTYPQRKLLIYLSEAQEISNDIKKIPNYKKILKRDIVQGEITNFLSKQTANSAPLSAIAIHVIKKTGCLKPTFYHYLAEMENLRKELDGDVVVCKLITSHVPESQVVFTQIENVTDVELKDNLNRATSNLTIDNVDLGLFQLGKIFESELRSFLTLAKNKNIFPVSSKDLERLVDMIDCIEKNRVVTQKHHLTLLREHRNERAHGDIPNLTERKKLMQYAPFLGDLYITYIVLFNIKRQLL